MISTTLTDFRREIKKYLDMVTGDFETLIINRGKGRAVVVISMDEYNSLQATLHEMSSKANMERLDSAIAKLESRESTEDSNYTKTSLLQKEISKLPLQKQVSLMENTLMSIKKKEEEQRIIRQAAESMAGEYENNKDLTEFTSLDFEDFYETR